MRERRSARSWIVACVALGASLPASAQEPAAAAAEPPPSLLGAVRSGTFRLGLRYRLETVADDAFAEDAVASTLRTTLAYETAGWRGLSLLVEAEDVTAIPDDDLYANAGAGGLGNGVTDRPVVADPDLTEINQLRLRWQGARDTSLTAGRQEILLGDERFVGPSGWRQNHQSFDAVRLATGALPRTTLDYGYLWSVQRVFGDEREVEGHLLWAPVDAGAAGTVTPYAFLLDFEAPAAAASSGATFGTEWTGARDAAGVAWGWELEAARQLDHGSHPRADLEVDYLHAKAAAGFGAVRLETEWEVLEGDGRHAFQTPLATLHKFDGWADVFLTTPPDGLEALAVAATGAAGELGWTVRLWDFSAERTGAAYGREADAELTWRSSWGQTFALKAALYQEDGFFRDVAKAMAWTSWSFGGGLARP